MEIRNDPEFDDFDEFDDRWLEEELELDFGGAHAPYRARRQRRRPAAFQIREDFAERRRLKRDLSDWDDYDSDDLEEKYRELN